MCLVLAAPTQPRLELFVGQQNYGHSYRSSAVTSVKLVAPGLRRCGLFAAPFAATLTLVVHRQSSRGSRWRQRTKCRSVGNASLQPLLDALQGVWEDNVGLTIRIQGETARFGDGSGTWSIEDIDGRLHLRGTRFVGTPDQPEWEFPSGMRRVWTRPAVPTPDAEIWASHFRDYKDERMWLRRKLWASVVSEEFATAATLKEQWESGAGFPEGASLESQARLSAGRLMVPGVTFRHRRYSYRGVIIACEPWCTATSAWRAMMGVSNLPRGDTQPFYHCLVDERDRQGGQMTFVGEENIHPDANSFPVQHWLIEQLLVPCKELEGFLPNPTLDDALQQQRSGLPFDWERFWQGGGDGGIS